MSALPERARWTTAAYAALENESDAKHELVGGDVYLMSGASLNHIEISGNLFEIFRAHQRAGGCRTFNNDLRVHVAATGDFFYPDLTVVCGAPAFIDQPVAALLNPTLIVEVLSPSTEAYDRTTKFASYQQLASLQVYLLVAQDAPLVELYTRTDDAWLLTTAETLDAALALPALGARLALAQVYRDVTFNAEAPDLTGNTP